MYNFEEFDIFWQIKFAFHNKKMLHHKSFNFTAKILIFRQKVVNINLVNDMKSHINSYKLVNIDKLFTGLLNVCCAAFVLMLYLFIGKDNTTNHYYTCSSRYKNTFYLPFSPPTCIKTPTALQSTKQGKKSGEKMKSCWVTLNQEDN